LNLTQSCCVEYGFELQGCDPDAPVDCYAGMVKVDSGQDIIQIQQWAVSTVKGDEDASQSSAK
jgi:hypothetical protein